MHKLRDDVQEAQVGLFAYEYIPALLYQYSFQPRLINGFSVKHVLTSTISDTSSEDKALNP